jgi:hypothetical protein
MTLKEKLFNAIFDNLWDHKESVIVPETEKIADEFAIGFAEWLFTNGRETIRKANEDGLKSTEDLLEIYKKEKYESNI